MVQLERARPTVEDQVDSGGPPKVGWLNTRLRVQALAQNLLCFCIGAASPACFDDLSPHNILRIPLDEVLRRGLVAVVVVHPEEVSVLTTA